MLKKVILKNFRSNIKNYFLFFASETIITCLAFSILALRECLFSGIQDVRTLIILNYQFTVALVAILFVTTMLLFFSVKYYMKSRMKDYAMFLVFGIRKNTFYQILVTEYFVGWGCSTVLGLLLGYVLVTGVQIVFQEIDGTYRVNSEISFGSYGKVVLISLGIVILAFMVLTRNLNGDLSGLVKTEEKNETRPVKSGWLSVVGGGIGLYIFGCYHLVNMESEVNLLCAVIAWIVSGILILSAGSGVILEKLKKLKNFYYKYILRINQYYHRYINNTFFVSIMFVIHFLIIGYMACTISEELPLKKDRGQYPYDYVCFGQEKDTGFIQEQVRKAGGRSRTFPMVRMTLMTTTEHIGISENTYKELSGKTLSLKNDEMCYIIEQSSGEDGEKDTENHDYEFEGIHTGKYTDEIFGAEASAPDFEKTYQTYKLKRSTKEKLLGKIAADDYHENTIVLSEARFTEERNKIIKDVQESNELFLINVPIENRNRFSKRLNGYMEKHGVREYTHRGDVQNVLYETDKILNERFLKSLFNVTSQIFIMASFCIMGVFSVGMKMFIDISAYERKYEFLKCMGMRLSERTRNIKKEIKSVLILPMLAGLIFGMTYLICEVKYLELSALNRMAFVEYWICIVGGYLAVQVLLQNVLTQILVKKVGRKISDESN